MIKIYKYEYKSYNDKDNAQLNLQGRTHYVDDDTLRFHKSKIIKTMVSNDGLIFSLIESCASDYNNTKRGFRYVIFDITGSVISRPVLHEMYKTSKAANDAWKEEIKNIDIKKVTQEAIKRTERDFKYSLEILNSYLTDYQPNHCAY